MARGSVFRKNGGWAFRVDAGFHAETGKRRQLLRQGFGTKRAAEEALAEAVGAASRGMAVSRSTVKVGEFLDDWLATARPSLRPTTARGYEQSIGQLLGAHGGGAGLVVAAGTGSVAAACYADGRTAQAGGWGFPVGDEGSGAWLGLHAMRHAMAVLDGRDTPSVLSQALFDQVGSTAAALLAWCAQAGAPQYAHLAPLVFAEAERGDATAQGLLQAAADELVRLVDALQTDAPPLPVVASGSVGVRLAALWPPALRDRVVPPEGDSADGALLLVRAALAAAAPPVAPAR